MGVSFPCILVQALGLPEVGSSRVVSPSLAPVPARVTAAALSVPWVNEGHACLQAPLCKGKGVVLGIPV